MDIYGKVRNIEEVSSFIPYRYQGQYEDVETELYYNKFRYYSPDSGIYISQDPIGLASGEPNFYVYVRDSNVWVDVFGLMSWMNGANSTVTEGGVSSSLSSKGGIHSEIRNLNVLGDIMKGQDVVISNVVDIVDTSKSLRLCSYYRSDIFGLILDFEAKSVTFPETRGNKTLGTITIDGKDFAKVQEGVNAIIKKHGNPKNIYEFTKRSDEVWEFLKQNECK